VTDSGGQPLGPVPLLPGRGAAGGADRQQAAQDRFDVAADDRFAGPMVRADQQARVAGYIQAGLDEGARLVAGGPGLPDGDSLRNGFYVRPTAFADVDNRMRIARDEIFGPVISVIAYDDDDAVRIANDSPYGLGGGVWSAGPGRAPFLPPAGSGPGRSPSTACPRPGRPVRRLQGQRPGTRVRLGRPAALRRTEVDRV
jgi:hypothetical protein